MNCKRWIAIFPFIGVLAVLSIAAVADDRGEGPLIPDQPKQIPSTKSFTNLPPRRRSSRKRVNSTRGGKA